MEQIVCPGCGTLNSVENRYCACCGAPVQAADALLHYAPAEASGGEDADATRVWTPRKEGGLDPASSLPPEPDPHAPVWSDDSLRPMAMTSEQAFAAPPAPEEQSPRDPALPPKDPVPPPELPEPYPEEEPSRPGFFRTKAGWIVMGILILAAAAGLIVSIVAIAKGISRRSEKNTDVGQPGYSESSPGSHDPKDPAEAAEQTLRAFLTGQLVEEKGVVPAVNAAPLSAGADIDADGISGLLMADIHDYLGEGTPQLLTVSTARVRMDAPAWDTNASSSTVNGLELSLYRCEAGTVRPYASLTLDGFGPGMAGGRFQPSLELARSSGKHLYLHFTDRQYGADLGADVYRAIEVDFEGMRVVFDKTLPGPALGEQTDPAVFESEVRSPLRKYGFYLNAAGVVVSLDTVPLLRCSRDENAEAGISVFSVKELTGIITETGLTNPIPAYSRCEDYLNYLQQNRARIEDYAASFHYQRTSLAALADLTGDGLDELIYVYTDYTADASFAYYEIVTSCGGYIVPLWRGVWETGYYYPVQEKVDHAVAVFRVLEDGAVYVLDQTTKGTESEFMMIRLNAVTDYKLVPEMITTTAERNAAMDRADLLVLCLSDNAPADGGRLLGRLTPQNMSYAQAVSWLQRQIEELKDRGEGDGLEMSRDELRFTAAGDTAVLSVKNASSGDVRWSSSNPSVASVGANGLVTALRPGTAVITASVGGKTGACTVTCVWEGDSGEDPPSDEPLRLLRTDMTFFNPGEFFTLTVLNVPSGTAVSWHSMDPAVATVDANGKVVAVGSGTTKIIATVGDRTGECIVRCNMR